MAAVQLTDTQEQYVKAFGKEFNFIVTTGREASTLGVLGFGFSWLFIPSISPIAGGVYLATSRVVQSLSARILHSLFNKNRDRAFVGAVIDTTSFLAGASSAFGVLSLTHLAISPANAVLLTAVKVSSTFLFFSVAAAGGAIAAGTAAAVVIVTPFLSTMCDDVRKGFNELCEGIRGLAR